MAATSSFGFGWIEILMILLGGGGILGMPPGDRDPAFIKAAPPQSLVYLEWSSRGAGQPGSRGIDGFAADPEIRQLLSVIEKALIPTEQEGDEEFQQTSRHALRLAGQLTAHPGALFGFVDPPRDANGLLAVPTPAEVLGRIHAALIVDAGTDAAAIIQAFNQSFHFDVPANPRMYDVAGPMNLKVTFHQEKDRLVVGIGDGTIERALIGLRGTQPGLDSNPRFKAGWSKVKFDRCGSVCWLDLKGATDTTLQAVGPAGLIAQAVIKGSGADALDSVISAAGVVDSQMVQRTFVATGGRTDGVLLFANGPALRLEQLSHIPIDSDLVLATSVDLGQLLSGSRDLIGRTNPLMVRIFDEGLKELESELHLNIPRDVIPAFGNAWTAFSSPTEGGLLGSSLVVAIEVRDLAKARVVYDTLIQLVEQSLAANSAPDGATTELRRHEFAGYSICHVSRPGLGFGVTPSMIPTFCLTDSHLLFAVHPQAMKAHLRSRSVPRPGFDSVARAKLSLSNQDLLFASYFDGVRSTQIVSGLLPFLGDSLTEIALGQGVEFDAFSIPSTAALVPYAGDVTLSLARQKDGLLAESRNPQIGIALISGLAWARSWLHSDYEVLLETRRRQVKPAVNAGLGAPEGQVVPAAAAAPVAEVPKEKPAAAAARRVTPLLLKALIPDDIQPMIPEDVFRALSQPPSPEVLQRREERRKELEERRRIRAQRRGIPPRP